MRAARGRGAPGLQPFRKPVALHAPHRSRHMHDSIVPAALDGERRDVARHRVLDLPTGDQARIWQRRLPARPIRGEEGRRESGRWRRAWIHLGRLRSACRRHPDVPVEARQRKVGEEEALTWVGSWPSSARPNWERKKRIRRLVGL